MFEANVLYLLRQYLGEYVHGLSAEALKISVWQGDVLLKDLQVKAEVLNALKLPVIVKAGFIGSVRLKVPWNRLGKESVEVLLDRIFILAEPIQDDKDEKGTEKEKIWEAKRRRLEEAELALLEAKDKKVEKPENSAETSSWLGSLIATIIGNLKISITNVHVRYEDSISNPGKPFCAGITLARLAAVTTDENGKETFVSSGALDKLHKSLHLERFAVYHDSNTSPWVVIKNWQDMTPKEWSEVFEVGISQESLDVFPLKKEKEFHYLLRPVDGILKYFRHGRKEKRDPATAYQNLSLVLEEVTVTVSEAQYCDGLKLLEGVSRFRKRIQFSHFRPCVPVVESPQAWWVYACQAGLQEQKKIRSKISWENISHLCSLRRKYVQLYADFLQQKSKSDNKDICEIEKIVDMEVLLLWRLLAHAKVETLKSKEARVGQKNVRKGRWWGFGWRTATEESYSSKGDPNKQQEEAGLGDLTKEEWNKINELLNFQPGEDFSLLPSQEAPHMLQMTVDATINGSSVHILDKQRAEIVSGSFITLCTGLRVYPEAFECNVRLLRYGLSAPEGSLIKSVSGGDNLQALTAYYSLHPLGSNLDWKFSATILPCYVTVWHKSIERFMLFLKSSHAVSPDVALETAAVLQNKLEQMRRRAQEQLKLALEEQSRFSIDLELDAPKVRLPASKEITGGLDTQLLLDLGHFKLHTANEEESQNQGSRHVKGGLYSKCYIFGSDIAAYLVDGPFEWSDMQQLIPSEVDKKEVSCIHKDRQTVYPVLERCGMLLLFEQLRIPHPTYPSVHVEIQVPHLKLYISSRRYLRLLQFLETFNDLSASKDTSEHGNLSLDASWYPVNYEGNMRVLFWKGLANAVAEWQLCWGVLSGSYLYILESSNSPTYLRCCRVNERQVLEVPPASIGGSEFVLAVCNRGMELQKGLESSSTVIMQFKDEDNKELWLKALTLAVYKASSHVSYSLTEGFLDDTDRNDAGHPDFLGQPYFLLTGSLDALQILLFEEKEESTHIESLLLDLEAGGGKVNILQGQYDMTVRMHLLYLNIHDMLQGPKASACQYIARSSVTRSSTGKIVESLDFESINEEEEVFNDALTEFGSSPSMLARRPSICDNISSGTNNQILLSLKERLITSELERLILSKGDSFMEKLFLESGCENKNFVSMSIISRQFESPDYDGTDIQMNISMATLEFFCNRPTVVALINFGNEISEIIEQQSTPSPVEVTNGISQSSLDTSQDRDLVKGLLGKGKSRVVFQLKMNMDIVRIFLNQENGSQLAMFDQERFEVDIKIFPGSFSVSGTLGNLRLCDMALGMDHCWGWICDIRDLGSDSLVKLHFQSFNVEDDDYEGYDYSLSGRLSAVRIVFLYKFIQEITTYFYALATPHREQFTRVVDKVGGIERLVPQSDIDGTPALKLNVWLETPIIIMPKSSTSKEFMQLDLGHLKICNKFEWHSGSKDDAAAVHLDVLSAEIHDINLVVGIGGVEGKSMIQEVGGLHLKVLRPLRDLFKTVPEVQVDIEVQMLKGMLSDKEYLVITECALSNFAETPNLPPDFRDYEAALLENINSQELKKSVFEKKTSTRQAVTSWTTLRVTVEVDNAELELFNGIERESILARLELHGLWLNYRSSSIQEMDVFVTLPRLCILDLRSDTKPEMRLMLGSLADTESTSAIEQKHYDDKSSPAPPFLVMDARMKADSQAFVIRIQRPRLLVVLDFLLAVGEFFFPSLAAVNGKDDNMDAYNDPITDLEHLRLISSLYQQKEDVVILSSDRKLIVDLPEIKEFIYDGCGNTLNLDLWSNGSSLFHNQPLIVIGPGKKLRFKNINIKNGLELRDCVQLHAGSSYSVSADDGVVLHKSNGPCESQLATVSDVDMFSPQKSLLQGEKPNQRLSDHGVNFILDMQAIAPEFTFYDSDKNTFGGSQREERLLRVKMDINLMYACKETDKWVRAHIKRVTVDAGSGLSVIDPIVVSTEYACVKGKTSLTIFMSDLSVQLSFSVMRLLLRLHDKVLATFPFGAGHILSPCSHFDRIWLGNASGQKLAIWKPKARPGYAILSHCITAGEAPPSQAVMAVSQKYNRIKRPLGFELVWVFESTNVLTANNDPNACSIWRPLPPPGYVAVGCVAHMGYLSPALSTVHCVRSDLVTDASVNDCIYYMAPCAGADNGFSIWRIENAVGSFVAHHSTGQPLSMYDLRDIIFEGMVNTLADTSRSSYQSTGGTSIAERKHSISSLESCASKGGRFIGTTPQFECMWWDKGSDSRQTTAIWRPIPPPGFVIVGDCITEGLEPPHLGVVLRDDSLGRLAQPVRFVQCMHSYGKGQGELFVWYPIAPTGYVTLGCVVSKTAETSSLSLVRCVRVDFVSEANIAKKASWSGSSLKSGYSCSLWKVENQANTFLGRPDLKRPPNRLGYGLVETGQNRLKDNLSAELKIPSFSVSVFNDFCGLITPLMNFTVTSINLAANGRREAFNGVCIASMAASTFNAQRESWEPLIEPFEGILKYESHDLLSGPTLRMGKRIRIIAANIFNLNLTSANMDALMDAYFVWQKQSELEQKSSSQELESDGIGVPSASQISSALEENDSQKLVIENKLGGDVYFCTVENNTRNCSLLKSGSSMQTHMPPRNFQEKITRARLKIPSRQVHVFISEARGLPVNNDGNGQEYFYSLRISSSKQQSDAQKMPVQSARSRGVRPFTLTKDKDITMAMAKWMEVFIFDLPHKGSVVMDVRVTNQAARAGKGELIGMVSIPLNEESDEATTFIQGAAGHLSQSSVSLIQQKLYNLDPPRYQSGLGEKIPQSGSIIVSIFLSMERMGQHTEHNFNNSGYRSRDIGLLLASCPDGPWSSIPAVLSSGLLPMEISGTQVTLEVSMKQDQKHVTIRSLVVVSNKTDVALEFCVCPLSLLNASDEVSPHMTSDPVIETEEIFENQRYQPLAGWGNKWPGHFLPSDPRHWSSRDYQRSSQSLDDLQASLPPGWVWCSEWVIDKAGYVDDDGWAYGPDFQSLRWPPNSLKSCKKSPFDFIKRRRWVRTRRRLPEFSKDHSRKIVAVVEPECSVPVPLIYISAKTDYCIQVRPHSDGQYLWGRPLRSTSLSARSSVIVDAQNPERASASLTKNGISASLFMLNQLQKTEELLMCPPSQPSLTKSNWWLSMEADVNILCTEIDSSVYDWRISVGSPLKIENLLPCSAEYILWEKLGDASPVKRDRGIAMAGGTVHIYMVDIRRPIYMTWLVQGGWKLEKDMVLISDSGTEQLPSTFSLVNQQSGRKVLISLERDFGGANISPRVVRIFVPYWLCNRTFLQLSYCLVEIEPKKGSDMDTPWLIRAVKAAKNASSRPSHSAQRNSRLHQVVQKIDDIEKSSTTPVMLSPQAYYNRGGFIPFSPRPDDGLLSPRMGISVAVAQSSYFKEGFSFKDLEESERIIVRAMDPSGGYYKLSVFLNASSERTKVVNFQPHTVFVNHVGHPLYLRQGDLDYAELLYPNDPPKVLYWQSASVPEVIKVWINGYEWSSAFSVESEGTSHLIIKNQHRSEIIRAEIQNGTTESRFLVIFRPASFQSPYRIENHSLGLPIQFRQCDGSPQSWQTLHPGSASPFAWEDIQRDHQLEIIVDGADPSKARKYRIDDCTGYQPGDTQDTPVAPLYVRCYREGSTQVVKVSDWTPSVQPSTTGALFRSSIHEQQHLHETRHAFQTSDMEEQVHLSVELVELGVSLVDQTPEEILYLSMQNFILSYATGLGSGISRFKIRVDGLQLDNQLPLTPMPVLIWPQFQGNSSDYILKLTITSQNDGSSGQYVYPYIGIQGPSADNASFIINIHEPILWRLHEMFQHLNLSRITSSQTTDVAVDPIIYIGLVNTSEILFKVSLAMAPTQRPRDALGFWASLMTALGNTDDMQVRIAPRVHEDVHMRQSSLLAACMSGLRKDLLSHPLLLLSGVDILGNASSALGHMSKGVAALSMDKKFIRSRQKQDTKAAVEGLGEGFREGAEAFGKGLFRGVTGILTKALEGARSSGMEGFVQGVGKGIIGVAAQPVSGVLDLLSKTTEGANAVKMKIAAVITSEAVLSRHRLPRVIGADSILRPYVEYKAQGQILLQLAEGGSVFGPVDIFKVRGKFAMTDVYEDHYNLPKGRILIITHRRVILLQHPTSIIGQKKLDPLKDPCSVLWDVTWKNLGAMELMRGKHDEQDHLASRLILHLRVGPQDTQLTRVVKCEPNSNQASKIMASIQEALDTFGHEGSRTLKERARKVTEPYSGPCLDSASMGFCEHPDPAVNMPPINSF